MTTKTEQATKTTPAAKPPMGAKAFDMIHNTVRAGMRYHSGVHNLKGMRTSVVRFLVPTANKNYIPVNADGFLIGESKPNMNVGRAWVIPKAAVLKASTMSLEADENGVIDLFGGIGAPWIDENFFKPWAAKLCAICGIDHAELFRESCRPQPRMFGTNTSIFHD